MPRSDWTSLPAKVREAIETRTGPILRVTPAPAGNHADIAAAVSAPGGTTFVKAARKLQDRDGPEVRSLRREALVCPRVPRFAPRLLWTVEVGGWLALGFEYIKGRGADYSPGSPDLAILAKTVRELQRMTCPDVVTMPVERRWENLGGDVSPMAGDALLHTDLNPHNVIITPDRRAYVVDWAFTSRGAPWVEIGQIIPWMLMSGQTPEQAEDWASQFPSWLDADPADVDLYVTLHEELWRRRSQTRPDAWIPPYLTAIRQWAAYRRGLHR